MHPTQRVIADTELTGIVKNDRRIAHKTAMTDATPHAGFAQNTDHVLVEDVDAFLRQIFYKRHLVGKVLRVCVRSLATRAGSARHFSR